MTMSLHRYDEKCFFPARDDGKADAVGFKAGEGYNVNVAWNTGCFFGESELGSNEYKHACDEVLFPIAREFSPDLILVACGFDSAIHDPLGGSKLSPLAYYWMTNELLKICPNMVVILEGGYNTNYLGHHTSGVINALLDV